MSPVTQGSVWKGGPGTHRSAVIPSLWRNELSEGGSSRAWLFFFFLKKIRNMIKAACTGHKRCIPHPFLTHYTLMHCIRLDCCSPSGVLINSRELIECLSQCWRCPWDIPLSAQLTFWFICLDFALISLPAPTSFPVRQS